MQNKIHAKWQTILSPPNILQAKYNTFAVFWDFQEQDPLLKEQEMTSY